MKEGVIGAGHCLDSLIGNFGENIVVMASEKAAPTPKFQNKEFSGNYRHLAPSVSLFGALSLGRVDPAPALVKVRAALGPPPG